MRGIIYYPYINPPQQWIKQALLYWDRICTIVPEDYDESVLHPDLIWLRNNGIYEAITADTIPDYEKQRLRQEILEYLNLKKEVPIRPDDWSCTKKERVFYGKFPQDVEEDLKKAGYLKGEKDYLEVNSGLFGVLLCLIAKYLSKSLTRGGDYYPVYTMRSDFEKCNFEPIRPDQSESCIHVLLEDFLPVPRETVSLDDILSFREKHQGDLLAFRRALDSLYANLKNEVPNDRIIAAAKDEISARVSEISQLLRGSKIAIALISLSVLVPTLVVPLVPALTSRIQWMFSGIAVHAIMKFLWHKVRPGNLDHPYSYVYLARREFE